MYVIEVRNIERDGIRYIAVSEKAVAKEDITEFGTLTEKGKTKFGLLKTDKAEIVGLEEFDVDTKTFTATDCHASAAGAVPAAYKVKHKKGENNMNMWLPSKRKENNIGMPGKKRLTNIDKIDTAYTAEDNTGDYFIIYAQANNVTIYLARANTTDVMRDYQPTGG